MAWDGTFSLTETEDGSAGFVSVPAEDVLFFSFDRNLVVAHTEHMVYFAGWDSLDRSRELIPVFTGQTATTSPTFPESASWTSSGAEGILKSTRIPGRNSATSPESGSGKFTGVWPL